ncbi:MAG: gluzincin family metallopeptidase [Candidatus Xenobia bacterium]
MILAATRTSQIRLYPQDPLVSPAEVDAIPADDVGTNLSGPRFKIEDDTAAVAQADASGNYLFEPGTPPFDQANTLAQVSNTFHMWEKYMGHAPVWSFGQTLVAHPHEGEGKTAYYSPWDGSVNFFGWNSKALGKFVTTCESTEVIGHEVGHAVLDGARPGIFGTEAEAFHEAFGDCSAMLSTLQYESNLAGALAENKGDFSKPSLISRLAEEFGLAFNREDNDPTNDNHEYYRTALNDFNYQDPATLPDDSYPPAQPEAVLTREVHSFSRVWTGTFYQMLAALFNDARPKAASDLDALKAARDTLGPIWGHAVDLFPSDQLTYNQVGKAVLRSANLQGGQHFDTLAKVLVDRNILTPQEVNQIKNEQGPMPKVKLPHGIPTLDGANQLLAANLDELRLPPEGAKLQATRVMQDRSGRTVLLYSLPRRVDVQLTLTPNAQIDLHDGLMLAFNPDGRLVAREYTPVSNRTIQDAQLALQDAEKQGRLLAGDIFQSVDASGRPYLAKLRTTADGKTLIVPVRAHD